MKIKFYRYTILDEKSGRMFITGWVNDEITKDGEQTFLSPVCFDGGHHVSVYPNTKEHCRIIEIEEMEREYSNLGLKEN